MDSVTAYAKLVVSGKRLAGKTEIACCKRHLNDLKRKDIEWRPDEAERVIEFSEMLHYHDENDGNRLKQLKLAGFQKFILGSIFGWYKNGVRRISETYIQMSRKNGKSFICGIICSYMSYMDTVQDAQIYTAATKKQQANIVWKETAKFIRNDPELSELYDIKDYCYEIYCKHDGVNSTIKSLSGDTKIDGFKPWCAVCDELHLHKNNQMVKVLQDGMVGLNNSLLVCITTAGFDLTGYCYNQYKFAKMVANGAVRKDELFVYIAEMDMPDSHTESDEYEATLWNEKEWAKANPLLMFDDDTHVTKDEVKMRKLRAAAIDAKTKRGDDLRDFIVKHLDCWTTVGTNSLVMLGDWTMCGSDRTLEDLRGRRCYLGLDLSSKNDLTSYTFLFPPLNTEEKAYIYTHSFLPEHKLEEHIKRDNAPYDQWYKNGLITLTNGPGTYGLILDYKSVLAKLKSDLEMFSLEIIKVGYDQSNAAAILPDLQEICGSDLIEVGQYPKSLSDATKNFRDTVRAHAIEYDRRNELLTWSVVNTKIVTNIYQQIIADKIKGRIDPVDSVLDAWKCWFLDGMEVPEPEMTYEETMETWREINGILGKL